MNKYGDMKETLEEISAKIPKDAYQLRFASEKIVSKWISLKLEYPHEMLDPFVGIEGSIGDSIEYYTNDPAVFANEREEAYDFYIKIFDSSLSDLLLFVQKYDI